MLNMITVIKVKQSSMFGSTVILVKEKISTYLPNQKCQNMKKRRNFMTAEKKLTSYLTKKHSAKSSHEFPCTDESCILTFQSFAKLGRQLNFGHHRYKERNSTQLAMIADKWVKRFEGTVEKRSSNADKINEGQQLESNLLKMGWAIPERVQRRRREVRQQSDCRKIQTENAKTI